MSSSWHRYLVYLSLAFVGVLLYRFDYLHLPEVASYPLLAATLGLQIAGFLCLVACWNVLLARGGCPIRFSEGLAALGLSVLGNYVPGKVWLIVGRAAYISARHGYSFTRTSVLSLHTQLITLWAGLALGAVGAFAVGGARLWGPVIALLWLALTLTIFSRGVHALVARFIGRLAGRHLSIPLLSFGSAMQGIAWAVLAWLVWSFAFYLFLLALGVSGVSAADGLAFPLAASLGVLAVIAPGGLGAREGVLVGYLVLTGHPAAEATTIAVTARLWFLSGELALFALGWFTHVRIGEARVADRA